jgi:hypothetical protein
MLIHTLVAVVALEAIVHLLANLYLLERRIQLRLAGVAQVQLAHQTKGQVVVILFFQATLLLVAAVAVLLETVLEQMEALEVVLVLLVLLHLVELVILQAQAHLKVIMVEVQQDL